MMLLFHGVAVDVAVAVVGVDDAVACVRCCYVGVVGVASGYVVVVGVVAVEGGIAAVVFVVYVADVGVGVGVAIGVGGIADVVGVGGVHGVGVGVVGVAGGDVC